ncbi:MAG: DUF1223 domain-containing protein [Rhodospirillales bacterium]
MARSVLFALLLAVASIAPVARAVGGSLTVVELFTSQGCSSCPPADALVGDLAQRDDVLVLSQHVDYWDYLGWKDPFARPDAAQRQRAYARRLGPGYVYTPQVVIDGTTQVSGSDRAALIARLDQDKATAPLSVEIRRAGDDQVTIVVGGGTTGEEATIWLVLFDRDHATRVSRGENRGRTVRNHNVVRQFTEIGVWSGELLTVTATMPAGDDAGDGCAVIVQAQQVGRILGAARLDPIGEGGSR